MYFAAQFRATTGYQPHEYIMQARAARANAMLVETDIALSEIAMGVGFSSQVRFSRCSSELSRKRPADGGR
jgi:AraC family transcriptional regulator